MSWRLGFQSLQPPRLPELPIVNYCNTHRYYKACDKLHSNCNVLYRILNYL